MADQAGEVWRTLQRCGRLALTVGAAVAATTACPLFINSNQATSFDAGGRQDRGLDWIDAANRDAASADGSDGLDAGDAIDHAAPPATDAAGDATGHDSHSWRQDSGPTFDALAPTPDANHPRADGSGVYQLDAGGPIVPERCPAAQQVAPGCLATPVERAAGLCDGLDNNCDGTIDDGCGCKQGDVLRCFYGPPGRHDVGACQDGLQTCRDLGGGHFGWGPCQGGIMPTTEVCDGLDNDCNGCSDEIVGCTPAGTCPGPDDPRTPDGRPFSTYPLDGAQIYAGSDATAWRWSVTGTPCDRMFLALTGSTATAENGQLSFKLNNATSPQASIDFTLSGDYTVKLDVTRSGGEIFSCTWIVHVRAPGLRVELCWDATGPTASAYGGTLDIDLHLGKTGLTGMWFASSDCDYLTCDEPTALQTAWGYASTDLANCTGPGARGTFTDACPNPRLDIDNISRTEAYVPENINLDNPSNGDQFRVMVHHFTSVDRPAHPLVNVYCGGELRGSYGVAPDLVANFDQGGGRNGGSMWRVVDVTMRVDGAGSDCDLAPIAPPAGSGYWVTNDDSSY